MEMRGLSAEDDVLFLATRLRLVEGRIGVAQQIRRLDAGSVRYGDTDACRDDGLATTEPERGAQLFEDLPGDLLSFAFARHAGPSNSALWIVGRLVVRSMLSAIPIPM